MGIPFLQYQFAGNLLGLPLRMGKNEKARRERLAFLIFSMETFSARSQIL